MKTNYDFPACEHCNTRHGSIFSVLSREQQEWYSDEKGCNYYKKGQNLFNTGSKPSGLYCIFSGKIKVYKTGKAGQNHILRLCGEGEMVGYASMISEDPYSCSAQAIEDSMVCFIPARTFRESLTMNEALSISVNKLICKDIREAEKKLVNISQKTVKERLAEALLFLRHKFGTDEDETLKIHLTREELSNIVGTAPESIIRMLSDFRERGILRLDRRNIGIIDIKKLRDMARVYD